jgi:hypothetical protein
MSDLVRIEPQPDMKPFQIDFQNRGPEYWYNERRLYRERGRGPMFISWKCPFGADGEPTFVDGAWYWKRTGADPQQEVSRKLLDAESEAT